MKAPYIKNCVLVLKDEPRDPLFIAHGDRVDPYLNGYIIIPIEEYGKELKGLTKMYIDYKLSERASNERVKS